jgi:hypothetical protein
MREQIDSRYITLRLEKWLNFCYKEVRMVQFNPKSTSDRALTAYKIIVKKNNDHYSYFRMVCWSSIGVLYDLNKITVWHEASTACDFEGDSEPYNFIVPQIKQEVNKQYFSVDNTLLNKAIAERIGNYIVKRINDHEGGDK